MSQLRSVCFLLCMLVMAQSNSAVLLQKNSEYSAEVNTTTSPNTTYSTSSCAKQQLEMCQKDDFIFSMYKKFETALLSNPKTLLKLRQVFFPITGTHIQEVGIAYFRVCISVSCLHCQCCCSNEINQTHFNFTWTTSPLISMLTIDEFLVMDNVISPGIYGRIATSSGSYRVTIQLDIYDLECFPQQDNIVQALIPLLSWAKSYARYDGRPDTFDERDKGYVAKRYNYFTSESLYKKHHHDRNLRLALLLTFVSLNILIPLGFAFGGAQKFQTIFMPTSSHISPENNIKKTIAIAIIVANVLYVFFCILSEAVPHTLTTGSLMKCIKTSGQSCSIPVNTELYWNEVALMVSKYVIVTLAVLFELLIAIRLETCHKKSKGKRKIKTSCGKIFLLWNIMVLVQIFIGMVLLPVMIFLVVAPAVTISVLGIAGVTIVYLTVIIKYFILDIKCFKSCRGCALIPAKLLTSVVLFLLMLSVAAIYSEILEFGISQKTIEGFMISLFPSFVLSAFAWAIRKQFLKNKKSHQRHRYLTDWSQFELKASNGEEHQHLPDSPQGEEEFNQE